MQDIVLVGGGGHCKSCIDVIESTAQYRIVGILDRQKQLGTNICGYPIIGSDTELARFQHYAFLVSVGQIKSVKPRLNLYNKIVEQGSLIPIIISSRAHVSQYAKVNEGTIVMHDVNVNAAAEIGVNCIINTKANIEHDAIIGDHCHISTGVMVNGNCQVGNNCFIGSGSVVSSQTRISDNVIIGAGSVVVKDILTPGTYVGNPTKRLM